MASEGFIHCSRPEQVAATMRRHFPGRLDMLMLVLDPTRIAAEIRDEDLYGRGETFPHIYGPLNLDAVIETKNAAAINSSSGINMAPRLFAGWISMLVALAFATITLTDSRGYRTALLISLGLMILADFLLLLAARETRGLIRGIALISMVPSFYVLSEFGRRALHIW